MSRLLDGVAACLQGFLRMPARRRRALDRRFVPRLQALELARDPRAGGGIAEALGADGDERRADVEQIACVRARSARRPCRHRDRDARGDGGDLGERDRADRGTGQPAGAAAEPRAATRSARRAGASAIARSVLISETASAPPASAASAQAATSAVLGVSLTISGLRVRGAHAPHDLLQLARVGADVEARSRRSGRRRSARSRRSRRAASQASTSCASSSALEPITFVISGTGPASARARGRSSAR